MIPAAEVLVNGEDVGGVRGVELTQKRQLGDLGTIVGSGGLVVPVGIDNAGSRGEVSEQKSQFLVAGPNGAVVVAHRILHSCVHAAVHFEALGIQAGEIFA